MTHRNQAPTAAAAMKTTQRSRRPSAGAALALAALIAGASPLRADDRPASGPVPAAFMELIELSLEKEIGLTFYLNGQALPAVVTKIIDAHTIEGRSQQYERIVIRLARVNAIAKQ